MFEAEDCLMLSGITQYLYCPRRFGLVHVYQIWSENLFTAEGRVLHERSDSGISERRGDVTIARSLLLRSFSLGIAGKADAIEFHREAGGQVRILPVEYKRGKPRTSDRADEAQVCAQAMCLEEMFAEQAQGTGSTIAAAGSSGRKNFSSRKLRADLGVPLLPIKEGALFYGKNRRRMTVVFDAELRELVRKTVFNMHAMLASGQLPPPKNDSTCTSCSLLESCLPTLRRGKAQTFLEDLIKEKT